MILTELMGFGRNKDFCALVLHSSESFDMHAWCLSEGNKSLSSCEMFTDCMSSRHNISYLDDVYLCCDVGGPCMVDTCEKFWKCDDYL